MKSDRDNQTSPYFALLPRRLFRLTYHLPASDTGRQLRHRDKYRHDLIFLFPDIPMVYWFVLRLYFYNLAEKKLPAQGYRRHAGASTVSMTGGKVDFSCLIND